MDSMGGQKEGEKMQRGHQRYTQEKKKGSENGERAMK